MNRISLLVFLLFVVTYTVVAQNYVPEYIFSDADKYFDNMKVNASKEICLIGQSESDYTKSVMVRLDKTGKKLWETNFPAYSIAFYDIDDTGNVHAIISGDAGVYTIYKFLVNGSLAETPKSFTSPSANTEKVIMDKVNNIYLLWRVWDSGTGTEIVFVSKYDSDGVLQWTTLVQMYSNFYAGIAVNTDGEIFVVTSTADLNVFLQNHLHVSKFASDGTLLDDRILETNSYTIDNRALEKSSIFLDEGGNVVIINEKDPISYDLTLYTELYIIDHVSLNVLAHHTIPFGVASGGALSANVTGKTKYIAGQSDYNEQNVLLAKISENHSYSLVTDSLNIPYYPTTLSLATDPNGNVSAVATIPGSQSFRIYIDNYNSSGTFTGKFHYSGNAQVWGAGPTVFDFENNLLTPIWGDVLKLTLCSKVPLTITSQPSNTEVCSGTDAKLQASVSGKGLSFYWYKNDNLIGPSTKFEGTDTGALTIKQASGDDAGSYYCEIKDVCGRVLKTQNAMVTITATPTLSAQPGNLNRCTGTEAIFQITASGGKNLKYQWKKGTTALTETTNIVGTKTNKLTLKSVATSDVGEYYCEVTSDCSSAILVSQKATLGIQLPTAITRQPPSLSSCTGENVVLSVNATGTNLTYQWKKAGNDLTESSRYVGTKNNTLTLSQLQVADAGEFTCVVTGACGTSQTSLKGVLTVNSDQQITGHPQSKNVCAGTNVTFSVTTSAGNVTYQWVKGNTNLTNNTKIAGANTSSLTVKTAAASDEGAYSCIITTACGNKKTSEVAQLNIGTTTSITAKSADLNLCAGELAKFSITTNVVDVDFQWKLDEIPLSDGPNVSGSKTSELFVNNVNASNAGNYTCEVVSGCGPSQISGAIKLQVKDKVAITEQPLSQKICEEDNVVLKVAAKGSSPSYQWKNAGGILTNSARISGATSSTLTIKDLSVFEEGFYTCEVTGCDGIVASNSVFVQVNPKPKLVLQDQINCDDATADWPSLVSDENNTFGKYVIFKEGLTEPLPGLSSIAQTGIYFIVKETESCSDTVRWNNQCLITGTEINDVFGIAVYPNPTDRWIHIRYNPAQLSEFELLDSHGRKIGNGILESNGQTLVDGNLLANGVYSVRLKSNKGKTIFQRLIVKR